MGSVIIKNQKKVYERKIGKQIIVMTIRYDDCCGNGYNSFSMTCSIYRNSVKERNYVGGGCFHDEIAEFFPEYAKFIKWHFMSSDSPMHYIANTIYHAKSISKHYDCWSLYLENTYIKLVDGKEKVELTKKYGENATFKEYFNPSAKEPDLEAARNSAIWPDATLEQLQSEKALLERLPFLIVEFKKDIKELGFTF